MRQIVCGQSRRRFFVQNSLIYGRSSADVMTRWLERCPVTDLQYGIDEAVDVSSISML
jgi:hypothetical protein